MIFWLYFHDLQNKRDGITALKDNSLKADGSLWQRLAKQARMLIWHFHSTLSEAPSI